VRWITIALVLALVLALSTGCTTEPEEPAVEPATPEGELTDAGDEAFVRRALPLVLGRAPRGIAEVELLAELASDIGREELVRTLATHDEYRGRWQEVLYDHLRVNRADFRGNRECYGRFGISPDDGSLAAWIRDHGPDDVPGPGLQHWTMRDLVHSALALDDLSVLWRAQLFASLAQDFEASDAENAVEVQQNVAEIFERRALGRDLECAPCHNSEWSITGHEDPARDRTWEIPGHFEAAVFGSPDGMDRAELTPLFRRRGVLADFLFAWEEQLLAPPDGCRPSGEPGCDGCACEESVCEQHPQCCTGPWDGKCTSACADSAEGCVPAVPPDFDGCEALPGLRGCDGCSCEEAVCNQLFSCCEMSWDATCASLCSDLGGECPPIDETDAPGHRPWGGAGACGRFKLPGEVEPDQLGRDGFFVEDQGQTGSAWELEALLADGTERIRDGFDRTDELDVDGAEAFAYLTVLALSNAIWEEAFGAPLTLAHHFPRNQGQRDTLVDLGDAMLGGGFSVVEVLVAITSHPAFNPKAEGAGQPLPPLFNPFTPDSAGPVGNGPGEVVRHWSPRLALTMASDALGWVRPQGFVDEIEEESYREQQRLGFFLKDSVHGFGGGSMQWAAAWEYTVGSCPNRAQSNDGCTVRDEAGCDGCGCQLSVCQQLPYCCTEGWDETCARTCRDQQGCSPAPNNEAQDGDRIDALVSAGGSGTMEDGLSTLKDVLLADPTLQDWEREVLADATGRSMDDSMDVDALRLACGLWLSTPQFLLSGDVLTDRAGNTAPIALPGRDRASLCDQLAGELSGVSCAEGALARE
jgi:hypothetical protein